MCLVWQMLDSGNESEKIFLTCAIFDDIWSIIGWTILIEIFSLRSTRRSRKLIEYFLSGAPGGGGHTGGEDGWQAVPSRPARGTFEKVNIPVPEKDPP